MSLLVTIFARPTRFVFTFLVFTALLAAPLSPLGDIQKAHALDNVRVVGGQGSVQQTLTAASTAVTAGIQDAFFIKEFTLDGIAHGIAKMILKSMTQSIVTWINSGFEGSPAFVTDLQELITSRVDEAIGEFIYNDPSLNFLCSPFQLDVKIALALSYQESKESFSEAQCTLSDVTDNVEGFLNGTFSQGGWQAWFELTQNPINTPTGAFLAAEAEMYARIVDEQGNTIRELDWGNGFLSFKVCDQADAASGKVKDCDITTPGSVIADQINKSLGASQDALISADEINEIISALFAQLAQKALTGVNGLLGLGASSYSDSSYGSSGNRSYLDALADENASTTEAANVQNPIPRSITLEAENVNLQNQIIDLIDDAEQDITAYEDQYDSCFMTTLSQFLIDTRLEATQSVASSSNTIIILTELSDEFKDAATPEDKLPPITEYQELQAAGALRTQIDNTQTELFIRYDLTEAIDALQADILSNVQRCERRFNE